MKERVVDIVSDLVLPIAESMGLYLEEVEYIKKSGEMSLTIFISKPNDIVTIDDCERLHRAISDPLDEVNPTKDASYILSVSSLGLDRNLKTDRDFERNINELVDIKLYSALDGKKEFSGKIEKFDNEDIFLLLEDNQEIKIERKRLCSCKVQINLGAK